MQIWRLPSISLEQSNQISTVAEQWGGPFENLEEASGRLALLIPLATVVIGGLVTSTLLTLLVLPAIYGWFAASLSENAS